MESIAGMQSRRMDEQRASLPQLPGLTNQHALLQRLSVAAADTTPLPDDNFFDMLMRCQVRYFHSQDSIAWFLFFHSMSLVIVQDLSCFSSSYFYDMLMMTCQME